MRVLHIAYQQLRRYGHTRVSWAEKLTLGLIKSGHFVSSFSDRDVAAFEAPIGIRDLGRKKANRRLLETIEAIEPDIILAGHCDIITNETLKEARKLIPTVKIAHCNNDALFIPRNVERIKHRAKVVDAIFVSTGRKDLSIFDNCGVRLYHIPNAVDASIESFNNSIKSDLPIDLIFCSNSSTHTQRLEMVSHLRTTLANEMNFKTYGSFGEPPIWGRDYDRALSKTRMGLNLNRQELHYWCSSARMAQLAGNGILTFTHTGPRFDELFPAESLVYFNTEDDLLSSIHKFHHDDAMRMHWAANAYNFFHNEMNTRLYAQYIVEALLELPFSHDYVWARNINIDGSLK